MTLFSSIMIGAVKPNYRILRAIWPICFLEWMRAFAGCARSVETEACVLWLVAMRLSKERRHLYRPLRQYAQQQQQKYHGIKGLRFNSIMPDLTSAVLMTVIDSDLGNRTYRTELSPALKRQIS